MKLKPIYTRQVNLDIVVVEVLLASIRIIYVQLARAIHASYFLNGYDILVIDTCMKMLQSQSFIMQYINNVIWNVLTGLEEHEVFRNS